MGAKRQEALGGLTPQEELMCQYYCDVDSESFGKQTESYARVYISHPENYKRNSIWNLSSRKFQEPRVQDRVQQLYSLFASQITPESIKHSIKQIATHAQHDRDKLKAQELLGKTHAMFVDRQEVEVNIDGFALVDEEKRPEKGKVTHNKKEQGVHTQKK
jgi:hypothetical protein